MGPPDVRIGIVSWNTAALLDRCLASLGPALGRLRAEIVVVDNDSGDDSTRVARTHAGVTVVVNETNEGYAAGMNRALVGSGAPVLVALNPDVEMTPGSLERLAGHLDARPRLGLVAPLLVEGDGRMQPSLRPYPGVVASLETGFVPARLRRPGHAQAGGTGDLVLLDRRWPIGAVHVIRAAALGGAEPYSRRWFMYAEDLELCWRLRRDGWQLAQDTGLRILHHGSAAAGQRWGSGAGLELRSLPNIYEWLWTDRSPALGRATALANLAGVGFKRTTLRLTGRLVGGGRGAPMQARAAEMAELTRFHRRVLLHGPPAERAPATKAS